MPKNFRAFIVMVPGFGGRAVFLKQCAVNLLKTFAYYKNCLFYTGELT